MATRGRREREREREATEKEKRLEAIRQQVCFRAPSPFRLMGSLVISCEARLYLLSSHCAVKNLRFLGVLTFLGCILEGYRNIGSEEATRMKSAHNCACCATAQMP